MWLRQKTTVNPAYFPILFCPFFQVGLAYPQWPCLALWPVSYDKCQDIWGIISSRGYISIGVHADVWRVPVNWATLGCPHVCAYVQHALLTKVTLKLFIAAMIGQRSDVNFWFARFKDRNHVLDDPQNAKTMVQLPLRPVSDPTVALLSTSYTSHDSIPRQRNQRVLH